MDWRASDKVLRQDSATMQYTEFLYLTGVSVPGAAQQTQCLLAHPANPSCGVNAAAYVQGANCLCEVALGLAPSYPVLSLKNLFGPAAPEQGAQLRMLQQRGEMYAGRAQYAVTREQPGTLRRYSTSLVAWAELNASAAWQDTANDISFYATTTGTQWDRTAAGAQGVAWTLGRTAAQQASAVAAGVAAGDAGSNGGADGDGATAKPLKVYYAEEPILLRFHLISPQPGVVKGGAACYRAGAGCTTSTVPATFAARQSPVVPGPAATDAANWVYTGGEWLPGVLGSEAMYVGVLNMRNKRVTHRIPLEDCGDAKVNATAYEDCELWEAQSGAGAFWWQTAAGAAPAGVYLAPPPPAAPGTYPASGYVGAYTQANAAAYGTRGISDYDYRLGGTPGYGSGAPDTVASQGSDKPAFWQLATRTYWECDEICLKVVHPTCPDSRASNGGDGLDPRNPAVTGGPVRELCDEGPETSAAARNAGLPAATPQGTAAYG